MQEKYYKKQKKLQNEKTATKNNDQLIIMFK